MVQLKIDGIEEIKQALQALSKAVGDRALLDLNKEAAKIAKKAVNQSAPAKRLRKAKSIAIKPVKGGKDKTAVNVGYKRAYFIARFFEKGAYSRKTRKGYKRGDFKSRPFVKRSLEGSLPAISNFVSQNALRLIKRSLEKYSNRLSKKLGKS